MSVSSVRGVLEGAGVESAIVTNVRTDRLRLIGRLRVDNRDSVSHKITARVRRARANYNPSTQDEYDPIVPPFVLLPGERRNAAELLAVLEHGDEMVIMREDATTTSDPCYLVTYQDIFDVETVRAQRGAG